MVKTTHCFMSFILQMFEGETIVKIVAGNCFWIFFFSFVSGGCMNDVTILKVFLMYLSELKLNLLALKSPSLRNAVM